MNNTISASSKSLTTIPDNNSNTSNGAYDTLFAQILASNVSNPQQSVVNKPKNASISAPNTHQDSNTTIKTKKSPANNAAYTVSGGQVVVTVKKSDSDNNNRIYWSTDNFKTRHYISTDNQTGNYTIGAFAVGTKIEFGIDNGVGGFYLTGSALKNPDGIIHAVITKSKNSTQIGFEDVYGGGDYDFNDVVISISNKPAKPVNNPTREVVWAAEEGILFLIPQSLFLLMAALFRLTII